MFSFRPNDAEENLAKRGAWQMFSHSFILHSNYRLSNTSRVVQAL